MQRRKTVSICSTVSALPCTVRGCSPQCDAGQGEERQRETMEYIFHYHKQQESICSYCCQFASQSVLQTTRHYYTSLYSPFLSLAVTSSASSPLSVVHTTARSLTVTLSILSCAIAKHLFIYTSLHPVSLARSETRTGSSPCLSILPTTARSCPSHYSKELLLAHLTSNKSPAICSPAHCNTIVAQHAVLPLIVTLWSRLFTVTQTNHVHCHTLYNF